MVRAVFAASSVVFLSALLAACASPVVRLESPACEVMRRQIREKQALDARVKASARELRAVRAAGDTAAVAAAARRFDGLREQQRFLKDALDQNSRDCSPVVKDREPVLDPAIRERQRLEGPQGQ